MSECRKRQVDLNSDAGRKCSEAPKSRVFKKRTVRVRSGFCSTTSSTSLWYDWSTILSIVTKYLSKLWCYQRTYGSSLSFFHRRSVAAILSWVYTLWPAISSQWHFVACCLFTGHFVTNCLVTGTLSLVHEHNTCSTDITLATYCILGNFGG